MLRFAPRSRSLAAVAPRPPRGWALLAVLALAGCSTAPGADAGPDVDAGPNVDAGPDVDAGPLVDAGPGVDAGPLEAALEVGVGEGFFRTFEDGATLELVSGCQGAQHVWVGVRAWGLDPRGPLIDLSLVHAADGTRLSQTFNVRVSLEPIAGTDYAERAGFTLVVPEPDLAIGEDLTLRATVTDMNGVSVSDERPVRIDWAGTGCGGATG